MKEMTIRFQNEFSKGIADEEKSTATAQVALLRSFLEKAYERALSESYAIRKANEGGIRMATCVAIHNDAVVMRGNPNAPEKLFLLGNLPEELKSAFTKPTYALELAMHEAGWVIEDGEFVLKLYDDRRPHTPIKLNDV